MTSAIKLSEEQQKEVLGYFKIKKEKQLAELKVTEDLISQLQQNGTTESNNKEIKEAAEITQPKGRGTATPLKYKIDEVLKQSIKPMSAREILEGFIKMEPNQTRTLDSLRKTLASALAQNCKNQYDRYNKTVKMGLSYFELNRDFKNKNKAAVEGNDFE